jgi:hypothetical protein
MARTPCRDAYWMLPCHLSEPSCHECIACGQIETSRGHWLREAPNSSSTSAAIFARSSLPLLFLSLKGCYSKLLDGLKKSRTE